jgi:serine/threonine-protein kinase
LVTGAMLAWRYRIVTLLGRGGMGEVYKAEDLKLNQTVALKFLPEAIALDGAMLARFHNEVRIARQVAHPNVCHVYDIGEVEGRHFLSMEFIDGEDLSSLLRRIGHLPGIKAVEIARQICGGLAAAHEQGVLHRDLKPANIMIDGRGKARITDFGLAVLTEELRGEDVLAGTPAYMAPEQLTGKDATQRSDIYALGLVLYELFTGKRVFEANNLRDLIELHNKSTPATPSSHVKDIDPLAERVILRCLEKDPKLRPPSAVQVALALPGGDPLAAALAMGETPSPEMVAAAKAGSLRPVVAVACLAATLLILGFLLLAAKIVALHEIVPLQKSPEVLAERAQDLSRKLGYRSAPADRAYGFDIDENYGEYAFQTQAPPGYWEQIKTGQPLSIYFWYRQSSRYLAADRFPSGNVSLTDPPPDVPGMVSMILDPRGRLVEFQAVPPQVIPNESAAARPDWAPLFAEAGLDFASFSPAATQWNPPGFADTQATWQGQHPDHPDVPIRIEAAAWHGQAVYFRIVAPWDKARRQQEAVLSTGTRAGMIMLTILVMALILGALVLARRNLRRGRGDRKGANKLAVAIFGFELAGRLLSAHHVATNGELEILYESASYALCYAVLGWSFYLALEPYVRRAWPKLLISWTRMLAGDFRDPLVGRDLLLGGMFGLIGHPLTIVGARLIARYVGIAESPTGNVSPLTLSGTRHLFAYFLSGVPAGIFSGLVALMLLLLTYIFLRREWLASAALGLVFYAFIFLFFATSWPTRLMFTIQAAAVVITVSRFGLLATIVYFLFFALSFDYPLTLDLANWYAGNSLFAIGLMVAISGYGFYTALGGQKLVAAKLLEE